MNVLNSEPKKRCFKRLRDAYGYFLIVTKGNDYDYLNAAQSLTRYEFIDDLSDDEFWTIDLLAYESAINS